ncbi:MAG: UDP-3-O-(3-hydroxymyristoyl)glucosamine N-acyltransferase [Pseudoxanthomonas sp.]
MFAPTYTAAELAERFGLEVRGDRQAAIAGVATLAGAGPQQLAFLANPRYRPQLAASAAGIVVVGKDDAEAVRGTALVARDPHAAFAKISALFERPHRSAPGVHPSAYVHPEAQVAASAEIGPHASVGAGSRVGERCLVGPGSVIGEDCVLGEGCRLLARVTLVQRVRLGRNVLIHPGAVLGAAGFGLAMEGGRWLNVPQLGGVVVGDDCEIGANTCIDRGALEDTVLEEDVRLDNLVQIGHNCHIGAHTAMAGCSAAAGSARIGRYCLIGGAAGIVGHIEICDRVTVMAMSMITSSIREPGQYASGTPMSDLRSWRRNAARFNQLDSMARRLNRVGRGEE